MFRSLVNRLLWEVNVHNQRSEQVLLLLKSLLTRGRSSPASFVSPASLGGRLGLWLKERFGG